MEINFKFNQINKKKKVKLKDIIKEFKFNINMI